jgi:hypothetical protein
MSFFVPRKVVKPSKPGTSKSHVISSSRHATVPKVNVNLNVLKDTKSTSSVDEKALARAAELALSDYALFKDGQLRQIVSESDESCTKSHYDHKSNFSIDPVVKSHTTLVPVASFNRVPILADPLHRIYPCNGYTKICICDTGSTNVHGRTVQSCVAIAQHTRRRRGRWLRSPTSGPRGCSLRSRRCFQT